MKSALNFTVLEAPFGQLIKQKVSKKLLLLITIMSPPTFVSEAACRRNSSETTKQNFMKLGR